MAKLALLNVMSHPKHDVDAVVSQTVEKWGGVDVLATMQVSISHDLVDPAGKEELTEEVWDKVLQ